MNRFNRKKPLQGNTITWILPVLSALLLNMLFFLGIPNLVHDKGSPHTIESMVSGVQFLRLKPHEQPPPPRKKKK